MTRTQNSFWTKPGPKYSPLGPQKLKDYPKTKSKSKVRIEGIIENESCSTTLVGPETTFESYIQPPKNSPLEFQKVKKGLKLSRWKVKIEGNKENNKCFF